MAEESRKIKMRQSRHFGKQRRQKDCLATRIQSRRNPKVRWKRIQKKEWENRQERSEWNLLLRVQKIQEYLKVRKMLIQAVQTAQKARLGKITHGVIPILFPTVRKLLQKRTPTIIRRIIWKVPPRELQTAIILLDNSLNSKEILPTPLRILLRKIPQILLRTPLPPLPSPHAPDAPLSHTVCTWDSGRILQEATCTEAGRKLYTCTQCGKEKEERIPATGHSMEEQWFGEMPTCDRGSYLNIVCSVCGFVQSSESVPALGCVSDAGEELFHGNCREETIVVYHCIRCGRETGFDRHYEPDEHDWITARTDPEWDEEAFDFVSREVTCCSRCGIEKGAQ